MKKYTLKFDREDCEMTSINYTITAVVEAETEEEARQLIAEGEYEEIDWDFKCLGDCYETLEHGDIDPETIEIIECQESD